MHAVQFFYLAQLTKASLIKMGVVWQKWAWSPKKFSARSGRTLSKEPPFFNSWIRPCLSGKCSACSSQETAHLCCSYAACVTIQYHTALVCSELWRQRKKSTEKKNWDWTQDLSRVGSHLFLWSSFKAHI